MIVTTTNSIEGSPIREYRGIVFGEVITGINVFKDIGAGLRNFFGGRSAGYEEELQNARNEALDEMCRRAERTGANAVVGVEELRKSVDSIIIIPNDKIREVVPKGTPFPEALKVADEVLRQGIRGIAELIVNPSLINLDFADVRTTLKARGLAHMGIGVAKGENRIVEAVRLAVNCPLLTTTIEGAKGVILNIVGGNDLTMDEVQTAATLVQSVVDYSANIIFGACIDSNINDEVEVTVIATGFPNIENMYNPKDERNASSRNFFVNRGLPERSPEEAAQPAPSPSYVRTPMNNTYAGQQPAVYRQPHQQVPYPRSSACNRMFSMAAPQSCCRKLCLGWRSGRPHTTMARLAVSSILLAGCACISLSSISRLSVT